MGRLHLHKACLAWQFSARESALRRASKSVGDATPGRWSSDAEKAPDAACGVSQPCVTSHIPRGGAVGVASKLELGADANTSGERCFTELDSLYQRIGELKRLLEGEYEMAQLLA